MKDITPNRFYELRKLMEQAFSKGNLENAESLAKEYLESSKSFETNWNYGNAIHHANLILGRIALENGDTERAKHHLIEAGQTKGSPQLNSFGPNMHLAKDLLELGERDIVIQYINLTKRFWWKIFSWRKRRHWIKEIHNGAIPMFGPNLNY